MENDFFNTQEAYNTHGEYYHANIKNNFWNTYIERPAIEKKIQSIVKNKVVIDLGCGSGILTHKIMKWGAKKTVGVDFSQSLINIAKEEYKNIDFICEDISNLSVDNNIFDIAVSSLVTHYIEDIYSLFNQVSRVLKKDGIFIFTCHHPLMFSEKKVQITKEKYHFSLMKKIHVTIYSHSFEKMKKFLKKSSFKNIKIHELKPIPKGIEYDENEYIYTNNNPTFILVEAQKL